jgi:hypothetical protein
MGETPLAMPNTASRTGPDGADELARLQAQRERLLTMIADQTKLHKRLRLLVPALMIVLAVLVFFGLRFGELAAPTAILTLVIGVSLLLLLRRQIRMLGGQFFAVEPHADELLAECEASISRLRERRS